MPQPSNGENTAPCLLWEGSGPYRSGAEPRSRVGGLPDPAGKISKPEVKLPEKKWPRVSRHESKSSSTGPDPADTSEPTINHLGHVWPILGPRRELSEVGEKSGSNNTTVSIRTHSNLPPAPNQLPRDPQPLGLPVGVCGVRQGPQQQSPQSKGSKGPTKSQSPAVAGLPAASGRQQAVEGPLLRARALKATWPGPSRHPLTTKRGFIKTKGETRFGGPPKAVRTSV